MCRRKRRNRRQEETKKFYLLKKFGALMTRRARKAHKVDFEEKHLVPLCLMRYSSGELEKQQGSLNERERKNLGKLQIHSSYGRGGKTRTFQLFSRARKFSSSFSHEKETRARVNRGEWLSAQLSGVLIHFQVPWVGWLVVWEFFEEEGKKKLQEDEEVALDFRRFKLF